MAVQDCLVTFCQFSCNSLRNGYSGVFEVSDYESQNKKWRIQDARRKNEKKHDEILKNMYSEVFGVAHNEFIIRFS